MIKRIAQITAGSLIGLVAAAFLTRGPATADAAPPGSEFLLPAPLPAHDVALVAETGDSTRLSDLATDRTLLLFFGYSHCPDVCPLTLATIGRAKELLGKDGDRVLGVMISVDPERDTPQVLADYLSRFPPGLRALTGSYGTIAEAMKDYGVMAEHAEHHGPVDPYLVTHTGRTFVVRDGRVPMTFPSDAGAQAMADGLALLLRDG